MKLLGPAGTPLDGSAGLRSQGEIELALGRDSVGNVYVKFGSRDWLTFPKAEAIRLAHMLLHHAGAK